MCYACNYHASMSESCVLVRGYARSVPTLSRSAPEVAGKDCVARDCASYVQITSRIGLSMRSFKAIHAQMRLKRAQLACRGGPQDAFRPRYIHMDPSEAIKPVDLSI